MESSIRGHNNFSGVENLVAIFC